MSDFPIWCDWSTTIYKIPDSAPYNGDDDPVMTNPWPSASSSRVSISASISASVTALTTSAFRTADIASFQLSSLIFFFLSKPSLSISRFPSSLAWTHSFTAINSLIDCVLFSSSILLWIYSISSAIFEKLSELVWLRFRNASHSSFI